MSRSRRGRFAAVGAAVVALAVGLAACGNAKRGPASGRQRRPRCHRHPIKVGSIANVTGPLSSDFAPVVHGVQAYFSTWSTPRAAWTGACSSSPAYQEDDQGSPTVDLSVAQKLVEQDNVFAVVGVGTPFFGGASVPRPGGHARPSATPCPPTGPRPAHALRRLRLGPVLPAAGPPATPTPPSSSGAKSIAVVAYGVPQSAAACQAAVNGMRPLRPQRVVQRPEPRLRRRPHRRCPADEERQRGPAVHVPGRQRERGLRPSHQPERP